MFQVERFGFGRGGVGGGSGSGEKEGSEEKKKALENLIQKSRQRIHYKSLSNQQQQQGQGHGQQQKHQERQQKERVVKPVDIEKLLETNEEKKQRKLLAKQEKRERKEKQRVAQERKQEKDEEEDEMSEHMEEEENGDEENKGEDEELEGITQTTNDLTSAATSATTPPVSYAPFSLPNKDHKPNELSKIQSPMIPPAIQIKEKVTVRESIAKWGVSKELAEDIIGDGIEEFFPVQVAVIPLLLSHTIYQPFAPPRDMIVSAPTGSGKTLAYALPIIQTLSSAQRLGNSQKSQRRLHALVILPSRELVTQVDITPPLYFLITPAPYPPSLGLSNILSPCSSYNSSHRPSLWSCGFVT
jgi:ATP-dependent RNA helicase DDX51/DBP6